MDAFQSYAHKPLCLALELLLRDTVRIVERDSIPYQVTITETKEIQRPLTWFDRLTRFSFFFLLGIILCWIYSKFGKFKH